MPRAPSVALAGISLHQAPPSPAATCLHPNAQPCRRLPNCETEDVCDPQRQVSGEDGQGRPIARRFLLPRWYGSSYEGRLLNVFLFDLLAYRACDWLMSIYKKPVLDKYPCFATRCPLPAQRSCQVSAFLDWQLVRKKAAKMVEEMAYRAPELRDRMQYPRSRNSLYHWVQASREACKPEAAVN
ncbi:uncharacterized protein [Miscanthus floridulus]|uniref:uncharacterized protein n=1 Tax=Miscanthus floridulus TaxID=154761 RepID=UPI003458075A